MGFNRNQIDDFDDFNEFEDKVTLTDGLDSDAGPLSSPLGWRRTMIERALGNVRKAFETKADIKHAYQKGELVFDGEAHKFARVVESRPGFLNLSLVTGGKLVRQDVDPKAFVMANRTKMTLSEMASELSLSEPEIMALLNQIELSAEQAAPSKSLASTQVQVKVMKPAMKAVPAKNVIKKPDLKMVAPKKPVPAPKALPTTKMAAKKLKKALPKKMALSKDSISFAKLLPKGATTDPVADPNGYVRQNFLILSNKELAVATGLSEHTIRRKLGEWGLKRKDFVNQA